MAVRDDPGHATPGRWREALEARLIAEFVPPLEPDEVRACVAECAASFEEAPVRDFVSVLVERTARRQLRMRVEST